MFAAFPIEVTAIHRVARETSLIHFSCWNLRRINRALREFGAGAVLGVLVAVAVTALAN